MSKIKNAVQTSIIILIVTCLLFIFPIFLKKDKISIQEKNELENITVNFLNDIQIVGKITKSKYEKYKQEINIDKQNYEIILEFKILDENPVKKSLQVKKEKIGENDFFEVYNSQIEEKLNTSGVYNLKEGDLITVRILDKNITYSKILKKFLCKITGNDSTEVYEVLRQTGMVTAIGEAIEVE